jgi:NAD(P)-dependent dehydrogenase (short-subunit alcohol dehydrogenase family)
MSNPSLKGNALVTGASTGIGAIYADRLAKRGYDLILVARNEPRLKSLSARLTRETGRSVKVLAADLNDKVELGKVEATLTIPSLQDADEWTHWEADRRALAQRFGHSVPAARYRSDAPAQQPT